MHVDSCGVSNCQLCVFLIHRVFVEFHRPRPSRTRPVEMAQPVLDAVYVALKRRQSRRPFEVYMGRRERAPGRRSNEVLPVEQKLHPVKLPNTDVHQIVITEVRGSLSGLALAAALSLSEYCCHFQQVTCIYSHYMCVSTPSHSHTHTRHTSTVTYPHIQPCTQSS